MRQRDPPKSLTFRGRGTKYAKATILSQIYNLIMILTSFERQLIGKKTIKCFMNRITCILYCYIYIFLKTVKDFVA